MKYTHVVFDIDGTLLDTEEATLRSLQAVVLEIQKRHMEPEDLRFVFGITSNDTYQKLGIEDIEYGNLLWQQAYSQHSKANKVFDGVHEALSGLSGLCSLGILTSRSKAEYQDDFVPFGLAHYFDIVICADDTVHHKPHPEPMLKYLAHSKANAEQVLYVGDTLYDMQCATGANADFALALWGCKKPEGIIATHYLSRPCEIISLL